MAPPTAAAPARRLTARPAADAGRGATRRAPLRVVPSKRSTPGRRRLRSYLPLGMIVASLLAVVGGQALLANGQVRMTGIEQQLTVEQGVHSQQELAVSRLETPSRIVGSATTQLHMVHPAQVVQLPYVPLTTPIPTPNVTAAPAPPSTASVPGP